MAKKCLGDRNSEWGTSRRLLFPHHRAITCSPGRPGKTSRSRQRSLELAQLGQSWDVLQPFAADGALAPLLSWNEVQSPGLCQVSDAPGSDRMARRHGRETLHSAREHLIIKEIQAAVGRELAARSEVPNTMPQRIADLLRELHRRLRNPRGEQRRVLTVTEHQGTPLTANANGADSCCQLLRSVGLVHEVDQDDVLEDLS
jgi:hypothetical protein